MTYPIAGSKQQVVVNPVSIAQVTNPSGQYKGTGFTPPKADAASKITASTAVRYESKNVNRAFAQIQASFKGTVQTDQLEQSAKNIAGLSPTERSSLVNLLARAHQGDGRLLDKFLGEVVAPGAFSLNGLDKTKQKTLFQNLIPGQNGQNIERIFKSLGSVKGETFSEAQTTFSALVAGTALSAQKIDTVARLIDDAGTGKSKTAARFIGELAGSLKNPSEAKAALSKLDRPTWDAVVKNSVDVKAEYNLNDLTATPSYTRDTGLYSSLASVVAGSSDLKMKTNFIAASGQLLDDGATASKAELSAVTKGMTKVIGTNTTGVIEGTLALSGFSQQKRGDGVIGSYASDGSEALRSYNKALMGSGDEIKIRLFMAQLRSGNDLQQDAFNRINKDPKAARTLGLYTGTVVPAIDSQTSDKTRAVVTGAIFGGTAIDVAKEALSLYKPAASIAKFLAPGAKALLAISALQVNSVAVADGRDMSKLIVKMAKPQGPGGESMSPSALTTFDAAVEAGRAASR